MRLEAGREAHGRRHRGIFWLAQGTVLANTITHTAIYSAVHPAASQGVLCIYTNKSPTRRDRSFPSLPSPGSEQKRS